MEDYEILGRKGMTDSQSINLGYVIIPNDLDLDSYLSNCFLNNTISICTEQLQVYHNVDISEDDLSLIKFPLRKEDYGSSIMFAIIPKFEKPIVLKVLNLRDQLSNLQKPNQFRIIRANQDQSVVEVEGSANDAEMNFNLNSYNKEAKMSFNVTSPEDSGEMSFYVNGEMFINVNRLFNLLIHDSLKLEFNLPQDFENTTTNMSFKVDLGFDFLDQFENEIKILKEGLFQKFLKIETEADELFQKVKNIKTEGDTQQHDYSSISFNTKTTTLTSDSDEPAVLGQKTIELLTKILVQCVAINCGGFPTTNAPVFSELIVDLKNLISKKVFLS